MWSKSTEVIGLGHKVGTIWALVPKYRGVPKLRIRSKGWLLSCLKIKHQNQPEIACRRVSH